MDLSRGLCWKKNSYGFDWIKELSFSEGLVSINYQGFNLLFGSFF
jgi:hypothetical protein